MKFDHFSESSLKAHDYVMQMRPAFSKNALFCDGSSNYRMPPEPHAGEQVTIRFRTQINNVDIVYLVHDEVRTPMTLAQRIGDFDYYAADILLGEDQYDYYFEIISGRLTCYYDVYGAKPDARGLEPFTIVPDFSTPDWAKGAVIYQIFVDRFSNGDPTNDVETGEFYYLGGDSTRVTDWDKMPAAMGVREFYGGDLAGIIDKLDYLQDLGVDVLYLNPIFVSPSNHKYDSQDYDYVDPHYGKIVSDSGQPLAPGDTCNAHAEKYIQRVTALENLEASNQFFIHFVEEVHRRGMKVILDGVFNHCGSFNKWMDRERIYEGREGYAPGAYVSADSPYRSYFQFFDESKWPYNDSYDGWWSHETLPKLNYEGSQELYDYILNVARKWVSPPYNTDGWRLDVAADLGHSNEFNHHFWKDFRRAVKEANPNALILAEHYGDPKSWLQGDEWDSIMNYDAFMEPVTWFFTGMEKHSDEFRQDLLGNADVFTGTMKSHMPAMQWSSLVTSMNELSNHDHSRFLTRTNHQVGRVDRLGSEAAGRDVNPAILREAVVFQMTWPGAPTIYYGDEAGVCGFTDPDNRRTYPWGHEDAQLLSFHRDLISLHKKYKVFMDGSVLFLAQTWQGFSFARFTIDERMIMAFNNSDKDLEMEIPVWMAGVPRDSDTQLQQLLCSRAQDYSLFPQVYTASGGYLNVTLSPYSALILWHRGDE